MASFCQRIRSLSQNKNERGFTIIEALVLLFIFGVVSVVFLQGYALSARLILDTRNRLGATALANQKMEIIRSLDYDTIGTKHFNGTTWVYGIPAGDILEDETINIDTGHYSVHTFVQYFDDPFDGKLGSTPTDTIPNDYKRVEVSVRWGAQGESQLVELFSNISPNTVETAAGGGVLSINILDSTGAGVPNATVHIVNTASSVDFTTDTDTTGNIPLPGSPAGNQKYALTVTKSGYYGAQTYPPYPTSPYNPVDLHASVVVNTLNLKAIIIDRAADIIVQTQDPFGSTVPSISFHIQGGKILGNVPNTNPAQPVYAFVSDTSTDVSGQKSFSAQRYGAYTLTPTSPAGYTFFKLTPDGATTTAFDVTPGVNKNVGVILLNNSLSSLFVKVTRQADGSALQGATVHLTNTLLAYDATLTTDKFGYAYFPTALPGLVAGSYTLQISATGFQSNSSSVGVSGALITKSVALSP